MAPFPIRDLLEVEECYPLLGVSARDLEFQLVLAQCGTPFGAINKWVPYGVPKIGDRYNKAVFFLYRTNPKTGLVEGPLGTGFFTYRYTDDANGKRAGVHYYGVTNYHIAIALGATIIRINTKDGSTRDLPFETEDWHWVQGGDDICAVDIDESNFGPGDAWDGIPEWTFLGKAEIAKREIGLGENAFMVGLFAPHHGEGKRNVISGRFGNVAMLADDGAPISTEGGFNRPAHVVDMHSRSGFSGSPVFVYRTPFDDLQKNAIQPIPGGIISGHSPNMFWGFVGIHCGQFQERVRVKRAPRASAEGIEDEAAPPKILEISGAVRDGDYLVMPSSMTVVVPSWRISELLNLEVFEMIRRKRDAEKLAKRANEEPLVASEGLVAPLATDENPNHRGDFNSLVDAAARKRPQGDQT
jgi:hypothetical protein